MIANQMAGNTVGFEYSALRVNTLKEMYEEELALVEGYISFLDHRRTGGILYVPEELSFGIEEEGETLQDVILETMRSAIQEPWSAAAIVPIVVSGPAEYYDKVRHIDLDNEFYSGLCTRAYKIRAQIKLLDGSGE